MPLDRIAPTGSARILVKLEYYNPTGSYKDRMALSVIERAEARGDLRPGMRGGTGSWCTIIGRWRRRRHDSAGPARWGAQMSFGDLIRKPSGFLPIAMSLAGIGLIVLQLVTVGVARQADEGLAARLFQLLLVAELPIVLYFAVRWLPRAPRSALAVLALQAGAGLAALAPLFIMGW